MATQHPKFIRVNGAVYQLDEHRPISRKGNAMTFRGRRWEFGIADGRVVFVSDSIHRGDNAQREIEPETGVLVFLARLALADQEADLIGLKEFTVALGDSPDAEAAFTASIRDMRNNEEALHKMAHCIIACPTCGHRLSAGLSEKHNSASESWINQLMENKTQFFDFSDVWTLLSSFEHTVEELAEAMK